jgi:hypothetical protein
MEELLTHDHAAINHLVLAARSQLSAGDLASFRASLLQLRDQLFTHFAEEEEVLFPLVASFAPDLAERIDALLVSHDAICGLVARLLASEPASVTVLFDRFMKIYADHAHTESAFIAGLPARLNPTQQVQIAPFLAGLNQDR